MEPPVCLKENFLSSFIQQWSETKKRMRLYWTVPSSVSHKETWGVQYDHSSGSATRIKERSLSYQYTLPITSSKEPRGIGVKASTKVPISSTKLKVIGNVLVYTVHNQQIDPSRHTTAGNSVY